MEIEPTFNTAVNESRFIEQRNSPDDVDAEMNGVPTLNWQKVSKAQASGRHAPHPMPEYPNDTSDDGDGDEDDLNDDDPSGHGQYDDEDDDEEDLEDNDTEMNPPKLQWAAKKS